MSDFRPSQIGEAKNNLIQVGRDYVRTIQVNFQSENWIAVILLVAPLIFCTWLGVETIKWGTTSITTALVSSKRTLTTDRAAKLVNKWTDQENLRLSISPENRLSASNFSKVLINESENTAEVDFYLNGGKMHDGGRYDDTAKAYFVRYSDGSWMMNKVRLTGKAFEGDIFGAGTFNTRFSED